MSFSKRSAVVVVVLLCTHAMHAHADTDALLFPASSNLPVIGYFNGGVGWSFVPRTNLLVTWVGHDDTDGIGDWGPDAKVTFWISTNTPSASYSSASLTAPVQIDKTNLAYGVVYGKVAPLLLTASTQYWVTLDFGSNTVQALEGYFASTSQSDLPGRPFQAASELTYLGLDQYDLNRGFLVPFSPSTTGLLLGPTFRFLVAAEAVPPIRVESIAGGISLSWPTNALDCVVETSTALPGGVWEQVSSAPRVTGDRYAAPYQFVDNQPRFFRLRLR